MQGDRGLKGERGLMAEWAEPGEEGNLNNEILKKVYNIKKYRIH